MRSPEGQKDFLNRARFDQNAGTSLSRRVLFAFYGLLAGDTALLLWLLPGFAHAGDVLSLYVIFSIVGWAIVGLPVALGVPLRFLCRLTWLPRLLAGLALGPLALLVIFIILAGAGGTLKTFNLANTGVFWPMSMLVSATSFLVYTALLRKHAPLR